jgi:nucleotide-binding universal stress UspA family protein
MTQPVVVVPDGDGARDAVDLGVSMARALVAPLVLTAMVVAPAPAEARAREAAKRREVAELGELVPSEVPYSIRILTADSVAAGLEELSTADRPGLLVLAPSNVVDAVRLLGGDAAIGPVTQGRCAVLIASPDATGDARCTSLQTIGVAWDMSRESEEALAAAIELAERTGAALRILHIAEPAVAITTASFDPMAPAECGSALREAAEHEVAEVVDEARSRVDAEAVVREGPVIGETVTFSNDVDLLVIGSHRLGPRKRMALANVGSAVAQFSHCPVLVVPRRLEAPARGY